MSFNDKVFYYLNYWLDLQSSSYKNNLFLMSSVRIPSSSA